MTSPIKPPGGNPPIPPTTPVGQANKGEKGAFADAVKAAEGAESTATSASQASGPPATGAEAIAGRLKSGEIDADTAMEELVQRALQNPSIQGLSADARADVEATLRATIADDPTFARLRKDLDR